MSERWSYWQRTKVMPLVEPTVGCSRCEWEHRAQRGDETGPVVALWEHWIARHASPRQFAVAYSDPFLREKARRLRPRVVATAQGLP